MQDVTALEEKLAHLEKTVEELSDIVRHQGDLLVRLEPQLAELRRREAMREVDGGGGAFFADERPPHY